MTDSNLGRVGVVAIGRNEGDLLKRCIASLPTGLAAVVYVDSGSTDGSVEFARSHGCEVVALDMSVPFTAARARNAGWQHLTALHPDLPYVQFIDGDCEVADGWFDRALRTLESDPTVAVVCGRRREVSPDATAFNRLCDIEWNTPVGEAETCGGDAMMCLPVLRSVGGYDGSVIAGEEPELCLRIRRAGHRILRIDQEMTRHDAAITHVSQWWLRNVRAGHAYAECHFRYGRAPERLYERQLASNLAWGVALPGASLTLALPTLGASLWMLGMYGVLYHRVLARQLRAGMSPDDAALYAKHIVASKIPQAQGALQYYWRRLRRVPSTLIEYK